MIGQGLRVQSLPKFHQLQHRHCWEGQIKLPYKQTWALPLTNVQRCSATIHFRQKRGAVGNAKYEPLQDMIEDSIDNSNPDRA